MGLICKDDMKQIYFLPGGISMTERLAKIRELCIKREFKKYRQDIELDVATGFHEQGLSIPRRSAERFKLLLEAEKPIVFPDERISITRTIKTVPSLYTDTEWETLNQKYNNFQDYCICNVNTDYEHTIKTGLKARRAEVLSSLEKAKSVEDEEGIEFLECILTSIDAVLDFAKRYLQAALDAGNKEVAEVFLVIPEHGAQTFQQALQFLRLLNFTLWYNIKYLITFGRFDQYMYPYYKADIEAGRITEQEAFDLVQEFFLILNRDSDLYFGVQVGDNGQSIVLGGCDENGKDAYNKLSDICIDACRENNLIDPKINLRVGRNTPMDVYVKGTQLTKIGLGFPQYCNDDVIIEGLVKLGYSLTDARNYAVAACWEYTISYVGMDIPNVDAVNFAKIVNDTIHDSLEGSASYEEFKAAYEQKFLAEIERLTKKYHYVHLEPCPWQSFLMSGCVEQARDFSKAAKYHNYGFHGAGIATGADSMATVKKLVFEDRKIDAKTLVAALDADFEGFAALRNTILHDVPRMGNDNDTVDDIAKDMLDLFIRSLKGKRNALGGIFRPGTGTAQFYMWYSKNLPATADGRKAYTPLSADYSPSLTAILSGPLSVVSSFTKPDLVSLCNGGPLTIELHDTVFRNDDGIQKTAMLVKSFIERGGHQFQLNTVNRERMLSAQKNPEDYPNLIVRVWGWSAYFVELDKEYQDHIISRTEFVF